MTETPRIIDGSSSPAEVGLQRWHGVVETRDPSAILTLLATDAAFRSPAVFKPQEGAPLVAAYLAAALTVFGASFRYVDEWCHHGSAILEFRAQVDGLEIEGIDRITWNDDGLITTFTVMVRPLRALHALVERMGQQLGSMT